MTIAPVQRELPVPRQLPSAPAQFTGRERELGELLALIREGGATMVGLGGLGGTGKSALAVVLAHELKSDFPDAQLYVDMLGKSTRPRSAAGAMEQIVRAFGVVKKPPQDFNELTGLYRSVLDQKKVILLLDNAADEGQVEPLIPPAGCLLLVTSRKQIALQALQTRELDSLTAADAEAMLARFCPRIGGQAEKIAQLSGHLPLALAANAGSLAQNSLLTPEALVDRLTSTERRIDVVQAAFAVSYDLLSEPLRACWRQLGVFPGSFDVMAAEAVWQMEEIEACDALGKLGQASLLQIDATAGRARLHDLVRDYLRDLASLEERQIAMRRHAAHFCSVLEEAEEVYLQGGAENAMLGLAMLDNEQLNIEAGQAWAARHWSSDDEAARLCIAFPNAGAYMLDLRQDARTQIEWLTTSLAAAQRMKDREAEGMAWGNLGVTYLAAGEAQKALECHETNLKIAVELGDRSGEGSALGNLGVTHAERGAVRKAIEYLTQALVISRELRERRSEAQDLKHLGAAYSALGETSVAMEHYQSALELFQERGDRRGEGDTLHELGLALVASGEDAKALACFEAALTIAREMGNQAGEGWLLFVSATALMRLHKPEEAKNRAELALRIFDRVDSPQAIKVRETLKNWNESIMEIYPKK